MSRIHIWSVADGKLRQVTSDHFDAYNPAWDPDGRLSLLHLRAILCTADLQPASGTTPATGGTASSPWRCRNRCRAALPARETTRSRPPRTTTDDDDDDDKKDEGKKDGKDDEGR